MDRSDHVKLNHDLAGGSHARDDPIARQPDRQMDVIPAHLVQAALQDKWKRLEVRPVDHLPVLEWVFYLLQQIVCLHRSNRVPLDRSDHLDSIDFFQLEAFLVVAVHNDENVLHADLPLVFKFGLREDVLDLDEPVRLDRDTLLLRTVP